MRQNSKRLIKEFTTSYVWLILVLFLSLYLRLNSYSYPAEWEDANRDYLVAQHIVKYKEIPLVGQYTAVAGDINTSPAYYYLLSLFLVLYDNPAFLGIVNILLQVLTGLIIFYLGKIIYGFTVGLLAAALFSINPVILFNSRHIWQQWVMQPFVYLSYLLLLLSYKKRNYLLLLAANFTFIFAGFLHASVFVLAPLYLVLSFVVLKKLRSGIWSNIVYFFSLVGSALFFYFPVLLNQSPKPPEIVNSVSAVEITPFFYLPFNFLKNTAYFVSSSLFYSDKSILLTYFLPALIILFLTYHIAISSKKKNSKYSIIFLCAIGLLLFAASFINLGKFTPNYAHYFNSIFGLFIILFSAAAIEISRQNKVFNFFLIISLIIYFSLFLRVYEDHVLVKLSNKVNSGISPAAKAILHKVHAIKNEKNYPDYRFFSIESYFIDHGWKYSATFWVPLERELKTKYVKVDDGDIRNFSETANSDTNYIFLVCPMEGRGDKNCIDNYRSKNEKLIYAGKIYEASQFSVSIMEKR